MSGFQTAELVSDGGLHEVRDGPTRQSENGERGGEEAKHSEEEDHGNVMRVRPGEGRRHS